MDAVYFLVNCIKNVSKATLYRRLSELLAVKISKNEIISNFTLSREEIIDIKNIYNSHSQLGYALQFLYMQQMFALTYLLGFKFKSRIKNSEQQQLYYFENIEIGDIKFKKINEKVIVENFHEIIRLVESISVGKVKASLILQKSQPAGMLYL